MVAWFLIALATLTIFTLLAVNTISNIGAAEDLVGRMETTRRMDMAVHALLAQAASPNNTGALWLPAGQIVNGTYTLPANLAQYGTNAVGQTIVYCPFGGGEAGTNLVIPSHDGSSYTVQTATLNGTAYIVGGRPSSYAQVTSNPNLLGWLISQRNRNDPIPSCDSVAYNASTNTFSLLNAIVRPIFSSSGPVQNVETTTRGITWYVSPAGTGTGTTSGDPSSLVSALDYWRTRQPNAMTISFANGSYSLPSGYLDMADGAFYDQGNFPTLSMIGTPGSVTVTQTAAENIYLPQGIFNVSGITFDTGTSLIAAGQTTFNLISASAGPLLVENSATANLSNVSLGNGSSSALTAEYNANVTLQGTISLNSGTANPIVNALYSSTIVAANATIDLSVVGGTSPEGMAISAGSTFLASGSQINFNNAYTIGIYSDAGNIYANTLTANIASGMTDFLHPTDGALVTLINGGLTGTKPTNGFNDYGAAFIGGSGFNLRGSSVCWSDSNALSGVLSQSPISAVGNTTAVPADAAVATLTANTAAAITTYVSGIAANNLLDNMRTVNQSAWNCTN